MPLIPSKLSFLPTFVGRESLYSRIRPENEADPLMIRILTVWPKQERPASIEGSLRVQAFTGGAPYNAISYYWGDLNELENVIIHGSDQGASDLICEVPVSKNLTAALRQFRAEASATGEPLRLWTDALCINQTDASGRAYSVCGMRPIFGRATRVRVWLGESDGLVERGLATLVDQANSFFRHLKTGALLPLDHFTSLTLSVDDEVCYIKQLAAVNALPYWHRGWTFQETAQPQKCICYGRLIISLESWMGMLAACNEWSAKISRIAKTSRFWNSIMPLLSHSEREFLDHHGDLSASFASFLFAEKMDEMQRSDFIKGLPDSADETKSKPQESYMLEERAFLPDIFSYNIFYRTSDPRDSVLALCEVIPEFANRNLDYTSTVERTFSKATEAFLRNTGSDYMYGKLRHWVHPHASSQLPSWVLDFTHCNFDIDANGRERFLHYRTISCSDASAGSSRRVEQCDDMSMHVAGFAFDEIHDISKGLEGPERNDDSEERHMESWLSLADNHFQPNISSREEMGRYARAYMRTLATDSKHADGSLLAHLRLSNSVDWEDGPAEVLDAIGRNAGIWRVTSNYEDFRKFIRLMDNIRQNVRRAKFFVTKDHRMGMAPMDTAVGDRIAIFGSGNVPFVLRPVPVEYAGEEAYRIIGGCYVDGAMHGEAV